MSGWSIGVMIDRWMAYSAARKQSRAFAPAVAGALRDGRIDEAIKVAERNKKSHLAKVVTAGLMLGCIRSRSYYSRRAPRFPSYFFVPSVVVGVCVPSPWAQGPFTIFGLIFRSTDSRAKGI